MIAVDERVSTEWMYNLLYTLGQAQFAHMALLVHDPTPSDTPTTELVGGVDPSEDWNDEQILDREDFNFTSSVVTLSGTEQISWTDPVGDTLQGTIHIRPKISWICLATGGHVGDKQQSIFSITNARIQRLIQIGHILYPTVKYPK